MGKEIIVDTSVLLSGIISSKGSSRKIIELFRDCKVIFVFSSETFEEFVKALYYPKILKRVNISILLILLKNISAKSVFVKPSEKFELCRDKDDNKFLDVVYESKVEYLITLDRDLLDLRDENKEFKIKEHRFKILRPEEFLEEINLK